MPGFSRNIFKGFFFKLFSLVQKFCNSVCAIPKFLSAVHRHSQITTHQVHTILPFIHRNWLHLLSLENSGILTIPAQAKGSTSLRACVHKHRQRCPQQVLYSHEQQLAAGRVGTSALTGPIPSTLSGTWRQRVHGKRL